MADEKALTLDGPAEDKSKEIILVAKGGEQIRTTLKAAEISKLVRSTLDADATATEIPLPMVENKILVKIVEYMKNWNGAEEKIIEKPLRHKEMSQVTNQWDATFINEIDASSRQDLYDIILAANYMDIQGLLHLGCAKVASLIKGQPLEKIKEILAAGTANAAKKE